MQKPRQISKAPGTRVWEIDFLRGLAIFLMVIFHIVYDLNEFAGFEIRYYEAPWYFVGKIAAILFLLIAGASTRFYKNLLSKGAKILAFAMVVTVATYFLDPDYFVLFGILHCIAFCLFIGDAIYSLPRVPNHLLATLAIIIILIGIVFDGLTVTPGWLFPLGLMSAGFASSDYYPLFPWLGVFLLGMCLGRILYKEKISLFPGPARGKFLRFLGRHSLFIYLIHQPVLLGIVFLFNKLI